MELKPNAQLIYDYVIAHNGENFTSADIAEATGLGVKSVDAILTFTFTTKGIMKRVPAEIKLEDGTTKTVKFIKMV